MAPRATAAVFLALAAPILVVAPGDPMAVVAGAFLVQSTMPLTVKAVHGGMPHRPAFAFALASAVLFLGSLPGLGGVRLPPTPLLIAGFVLASAASLVVGLRLLARGERGDRLHRSEDGRDELTSPPA